MIFLNKRPLKRRFVMTSKNPTKKELKDIAEKAKKYISLPEGQATLKKILERARESREKFAKANQITFVQLHTPTTI